MQQQPPARPAHTKTTTCCAPCCCLPSKSPPANTRVCARAASHPCPADRTSEQASGSPNAQQLTRGGRHTDTMQNRAAAGPNASGAAACTHKGTAPTTATNPCADTVTTRHGHTPRRLPCSLQAQPSGRLAAASAALPVSSAPHSSCQFTSRAQAATRRVGHTSINNSARPRKSSTGRRASLVGERGCRPGAQRQTQMQNTPACTAGRNHHRPHTTTHTHAHAYTPDRVRAYAQQPAEAHGTPAGLAALMR